MKKILFIALFIFQGVIRFYGQVPDTITLDFCYKQAERNWPLVQQKEMLDNSETLRIKNLNKNWLPQLNINGNASLQSEVTKLNIPLSAGIPPIQSPELSKDLYKLTLDVNQSVYDGNVTSYEKKLENFNVQADQKNIQAELYNLKDRINQVYFGIFLTQQEEDVLKTNLDLLDSKLKEVQSGVKNGVQLASNADAIQAEILRTTQKISELQTDRSTAFRMLSELISVTLPESSQLSMPEIRITSFIFENKRYEYELFDIQQRKISLMKNMVATQWNPRLYAYGQLGYGRPGFNFLSNDFTTFWIFGARLTWNFYNWNRNKNEKKIYNIQNDIIRTQKETFDKNLRIASDKEAGEITKISGSLQKDEEIIELRRKITKTASSQLDNGVITSSEFIDRLNEETQARLLYELHKIQLANAKLSFLYTLGKL